MRSSLDAAAGGALSNMYINEVYELIESMALNNRQWSNERAQSKKDGGKYEVDPINMLAAKFDALSQQLGKLNVNQPMLVNAIMSPTPMCETCGGYDHVATNCLMGTPIPNDPSDQVNYLGNYP